ncbi:NAD(P)-binding protein [Aureobasidium pullulans]|uniref:NAD(P)-binding protein n=1 Tax=Aureobasidium pullulans TaxID=5580 RepID=A0AB74JV89_AURPU|nr:NAD(P)-binding protein [Aureobasidium pullulans]
MAPAAPVALITGGSSVLTPGIGLALTKHLLSQSWHVFIADINPPPASELADFPPSTHHFHITDVSSWGAQSSAFATCFSHFGRLDFCALNAGIDDRDDIFHSTSNELDLPPTKPNMKTFEVNLFGPYYGVKLAAHYMALNPPLMGKGEGKGGRIVITASDAGLWALPAVPQYTATKHAVVGLVRSLAPSAAQVGISINAVAPALTPSNLAPPGLLESYPKEALTKMETLLRAFDALGRFDEVEGEGWGGEEPNGQIVEGRGEDIYYKGEMARTAGKEVPKHIQKIWTDTYKERNKKFAMQNQD